MNYMKLCEIWTLWLLHEGVLFPRSQYLVVPVYNLRAGWNETNKKNFYCVWWSHCNFYLLWIWNLNIFLTGVLHQHSDRDLDTQRSTDRTGVMWQSLTASVCVCVWLSRVQFTCDLSECVCVCVCSHSPAVFALHLHRGFIHCSFICVCIYVCCCAIYKWLQNVLLN